MYRKEKSVGVESIGKMTMDWLRESGWLLHEQTSYIDDQQLFNSLCSIYKSASCDGKKAGKMLMQSAKLRTSLAQFNKKMHEHFTRAGNGFRNQDNDEQSMPDRVLKGYHQWAEERLDI